MISFYPTSKVFKQVSNGKVIIVMRTKNRLILLARALASVLSQTYENWHLCLVNDGGDQAGLNKLLETYLPSLNGRFTLKHHSESLGMEAASNAALEGVEGDYIVVHDDDDAWRPTFLEETVAFLEKDNNISFAAVAARCEVVYEIIENNRVIEKEIVPWGYWKERVDFSDMLVTNSIPPICLLVRKEVFDLIGNYNANLPVLGDWDFSLRLLIIGDIGTINHPLAYYHQRQTSEESDIYGNSVRSGLNKHLDYQVLYRNSILRQAFSNDSSSLGLMHVLLSRISLLDHKITNIDNQLARIENNLDHKLNGMHWDINNRSPWTDYQLVEDLRHHLYKMKLLLKPFQYVWKLLKPLRIIWRKILIFLKN